MAEISLLDLKPHKVSRDLRGYSVMFYGAAKTGKTTISSHFPGALLCAFEKGYNALPDIYAQPILSWGDFKKVINQLKQPGVAEKFQTVIVDTADIAYDFCVKYICSRESTAEKTYETIGDIPYGKGYTLAMQEFDEQLRKILQMNYGLVLISHEKDKVFKDEQGQEYNKIVPSLDTRAALVCERTCDIIGYAREVNGENGVQTRLFLRGTPRYDAGSRFRYTPDSIEFSYEALTNAIAEAVEKEAAHGADRVTDQVQAPAIYADEQSYDFKGMMDEFQEIVGKLVQKSPNMAGKITLIVDKHLGKGKKVSDCTAANAPQLDLILYELRELNK
ncbi:MAG: ATP-binding protein [Bacilli bacterium]|nr:ATP-binding protein [Bacilli bacterium]